MRKSILSNWWLSGVSILINQVKYEDLVDTKYEDNTNVTYEG